MTVSCFPVRNVTVSLQVHRSHVFLNFLDPFFCFVSGAHILNFNLGAHSLDHNSSKIRVCELLQVALYKSIC